MAQQRRIRKRHNGHTENTLANGADNRSATPQKLEFGMADDLRRIGLLV